MDQKTRNVLDAANKWLTAIEAVTAADEERRGSHAEQDELDGAEVGLASAVKAWRTAAHDEHA